MKKLVMLVLLAFGVVMTSLGTQAAEGDPVVIYPYDQEGCLSVSDPCVGTRVGDSHWDVEYNGYIYNVVGKNVRYTSDYHDDNSDGFYSDVNEVTQTGWGSFGALTINNTDETYIISTTSTRASYSSTVHRIYAYFDVDGKLQMFEDHIHMYYIFNDGTPEAPDWRLATQAEADAFDAADPKPVTTRYTHIRMKLDSTDTDGYVLEPLKYIAWTNADVDTTTELDVEKWSTVVTGNPNFITIPAGWSVLSYAANDRGGYTKPLAMINAMPEAMIDSTVANAVVEYTPQPATFTGITAMDDDGTTPGVNVVVDYQSSFDLPNTVTASWVNMFDTEGTIINATEKLSYKVEISQEDVLLETIDFVYDETLDTYTPSAAVTSIDSSEFGAGYKAKYIVTNPEAMTTEYEIDIVVGVMPPKFMGVEDRFHDENTYIDLMEGITADDGYGNDITNTIQVTYPQGFNFYNPRAGEYQIDLTFTHHVHIPGIDYSIQIKDGAVTTFDPTVVLNQDKEINVAASYAPSKYLIWTDVTHFTNSITSWGSMIVVVAADGTMKESFSRFDWKHITETETVIKDETQFNAWKAALTLEEGEFIVASHGSTNSAEIRPLLFGEAVTLVIGVPDFDTDIVKETSYTLTIDDKTAPQLVVVDPNFTFETGDFSSVNNAILSNVVAIDNYDTRNDIAIFVASNGGLSTTVPGTYSVSVSAEDRAGNVTTVDFDIVVVEKAVTEEKVDDKIDEKVTETEQELLDYVNDNTLTLEEIQELIANKEDIKGTSLGVTVAISLASSMIAFALAFFLLKKRP
jgi:hypothetical protein